MCVKPIKKIMNLRQLRLLMYSNDKLIIKFLIKALTLIFKNGLLIYYSNYPWFHISIYQLDITSIDLFIITKVTCFSKIKYKNQIE